jgi:very-short-patch-repair endonuclease
VVEVDGSIHARTVERDRYRNREMLKRGFSVLRVSSTLVEANIDDVVDNIGWAVRYCRG